MSSGFHHDMGIIVVWSQSPLRAVVMGAATFLIKKIPGAKTCYKEFNALR